ncbi:hypothetical protein WR25_00776 [Diploscapter pachys]|uniref:Uncharacterized protein n=1 Tax=Diploscapter pachys TaxID=2018661 RepID=A0A2A2KHS9_9BILA|nr:hypothetical protein WR25_00776 [Diploscapter pachys]
MGSGWNSIQWMAKALLIITAVSACPTKEFMPCVIQLNAQKVPFDTNILNVLSNITTEAKLLHTSAEDILAIDEMHTKHYAIIQQPQLHDNKHRIYEQITVMQVKCSERELEVERDHCESDDMICTSKVRLAEIATCTYTEIEEQCDHEAAEFYAQLQNTLTNKEYPVQCQYYLHNAKLVQQQQAAPRTVAAKERSKSPPVNRLPLEPIHTMSATTTTWRPKTSTTPLKIFPKKKFNQDVTRQNFIRRTQPKKSRAYLKTHTKAINTTLATRTALKEMRMRMKLGNLTAPTFPIFHVDTTLVGSTEPPQTQPYFPLFTTSKALFHSMVTTTPTPPSKMTSMPTTQRTTTPTPTPTPISTTTKIPTTTSRTFKFVFPTTTTTTTPTTTTTTTTTTTKATTTTSTAKPNPVKTTVKPFKFPAFTTKALETLKGILPKVIIKFTDEEPHLAHGPRPIPDSTLYYATSTLPPPPHNDNPMPRSNEKSFDIMRHFDFYSSTTAPITMTTPHWSKPYEFSFSPTRKAFVNSGSTSGKWMPWYYRPMGSTPSGMIINEGKTATTKPPMRFSSYHPTLLPPTPAPLYAHLTQQKSDSSLLNNDQPPVIPAIKGTGSGNQFPVNFDFEPAPKVDNPFKIEINWMDDPIMENPWYSQVTPRLYPTTTESPPVNSPLSAIQPIFNQFRSDTLNLTDIRSKANNYLSAALSAFTDSNDPTLHNDPWRTIIDAVAPTPPMKRLVMIQLE